MLLLVASCTAGIALAVQQLTIELDKNYQATFKIGAKTSVLMTALLNFEQTLVTSATCPNCPSKVYTPKPSTDLSRKENYTYVSSTGDDIGYEGLEVIDTLCIPTLDDFVCTEDQADITEDDYTIMVLTRFLKGDVDTNPDFGGVLGLTPGLQKDFTLGSYYRRMKLSDSNTVALQRRINGFVLNYGRLPSSENITYVPFNKSNTTGLW